MSKDRSSPINLIQYLRQNTHHSRRDILSFIMAGDVDVDGAPVYDANVAVLAQQQIYLRGSLVLPQPFSTYMFHKPVGTLSTMDDPSNRRSLRTHLNTAKLPHTLKPCGRLDKDSSGLLLFSNDGHFINTILHPSFHVPKTYRVALSTPLTDDHKRQLSSGIFLDDGPVSLTFQDTFTNQDFIVEISIGRNRIIRRAFEYFGHTLTTLHRLSIGPFQLNQLKPGRFSPISMPDIHAFYATFSP